MDFAVAIANWIEIGRMDDWARREAPMQRLDARAKLVVTLVFVVVVTSFPRHAVSALTPLLFYPLALTAGGHLPVGPLFRKLLVAAPFALVVALAAPVVERGTVLVVGPLALSGGWLSCASILLRFVLTVWAVLALVACTGIHPLGAGMERLGVPRLFVVQLLFLYRYLFVLADEGSRMVRSVALRAGTRRALSLRVYGALVGQLLLRALDRAERVHRAMVARGFDGEIRVWRRTLFRAADWLFIGGCLAGFAAARVWNLAEGLGRWLTGGAA